MSRWTSKYSDAQKSAIVSAALDENRRTGEILQAAKAGELGGLPAFTMPDASARNYISMERKRRRENGRGPLERIDRKTALELAETRAFALMDARIRKAERPRAQPDSLELQGIFKVIEGAARAHSAVQAATNGNGHAKANGKGSGGPAHEGEGPKDPAAQFFAGLARDLEDAPRTETIEPDNTDDGEGSPHPAATQEEEPTDRTTGGFLSARESAGV